LASIEILPLRLYMDILFKFEIGLGIPYAVAYEEVAQVVEEE